VVQFCVFAASARVSALEERDRERKHTHTLPKSTTIPQGRVQNEARARSKRWERNMARAQRLLLFVPCL